MVPYQIHFGSHVRALPWEYQKEANCTVAVVPLVDGLAYRLHAPASPWLRNAEASRNPGSIAKLGWRTFRSSGPMSPEALAPITSWPPSAGLFVSRLRFPFRIRGSQAGFQLTAIIVHGTILVTCIVVGLLLSVRQSHRDIGTSRG